MPSPNASRSHKSKPLLRIENSTVPYTVSFGSGSTTKVISCKYKPTFKKNGKTDISLKCFVNECLGSIESCTEFLSVIIKLVYAGKLQYSLYLRLQAAVMQLALDLDVLPEKLELLYEQMGPNLVSLSNSALKINVERRENIEGSPVYYTEDENVLRYLPENSERIAEMMSQVTKREKLANPKLCPFPRMK